MPHLDLKWARGMHDQVYLSRSCAIIPGAPNLKSVLTKLTSDRQPPPNSIPSAPKAILLKLQKPPASGGVAPKAEPLEALNPRLVPQSSTGTSPQVPNHYKPEPYLHLILHALDLHYLKPRCCLGSASRRSSSWPLP